MDRTSLFKMTTLPDAFGVVLLVFSFILLLAPYFSGTDFGLFKVPTVNDPTKKVLKIIGPVIFISIVLLFVPIVPNTKEVVSASPSPSPTPVSFAEVTRSPATSPQASVRYDGVYRGFRTGPDESIMWLRFFEGGTVVCLYAEPSLPPDQAQFLMKYANHQGHYIIRGSKIEFSVTGPTLSSRIDFTGTIGDYYLELQFNGLSGKFKFVELPSE
jgi:hypothetical protein